MSHWIIQSTDFFKNTALFRDRLLCVATYWCNEVTCRNSHWKIPILTQTDSVSGTQTSRMLKQWKVTFWIILAILEWQSVSRTGTHCCIILLEITGASMADQAILNMLHLLPSNTPPPPCLPHPHTPQHVVNVGSNRVHTKYKKESQYIPVQSVPFRWLVSFSFLPHFSCLPVLAICFSAMHLSARGILETSNLCLTVERVVTEIYPKELHGAGIMGGFSGSFSVTGQGLVHLSLV